jgi:2-keto-4-pentenoate hydratase/2-oxohepta-3-ene-1,7-dioic acid hydratase in catechol pathway
MQIVRSTDGKKVKYGIREGAGIRGIVGTPYRSIRPDGSYYRLAEVRLLAPCLPSKIVALGLNYHSHAEEVRHRLPVEPLIFIKPSTSVIGPEDSIIYPETSERVDYEGELGVVIGKEARHVSEKAAARYILGYTCVNDVTARDLQARDKQWTRSKAFDTFAPIGPVIETELDPHNLTLETYLNGELRQSAHTSDLIFSASELVSFISRVMTLLPGDIIATGTTSGIGPMLPGDTVEVKIEKIGTLRNYVTKCTTR